MRKAWLDRAPSLVMALLVLAALYSSSEAASAASLKVLHDFCPKAPCVDGNNPQSGLLIDISSNLYGSTSEGGRYNHGAVYQLSLNATKTAWDETVLHDFCPPGPTCVDGAAPYGRLVTDGSGNLYGTTSSGGAHGHGIVFKLAPDATKTTWTLTVLYSFGSNGSSDADGPYAGVVMDISSGRLYGTTYYGGVYGAGTVFVLTPNPSGWTEKVLYSFGSAGRGDASGPYYAALILGQSGNLYGTTVGGGLYGAGTVFELTPPSATKAAWTETVLYNFCSQSKCADGSVPQASLFLDDVSGKLYGTAYRGGAHNAGVVFELASNTTGTAWKQTVLWSFGGTGDGAEPWAEVIMDGSGRLYGTTFTGGVQNGGTIFELTPNAGNTGWNETAASFCAPSNCNDGSEPVAGLTMDKLGNLYGTTWANGPYLHGTVFEY
jgi:uncharacterized repeat protein (TIGR03803 family)